MGLTAWLLFFNPVVGRINVTVVVAVQTKPFDVFLWPIFDSFWKDDGYYFLAR
jgi:hypothetical protein